MNQPQRHGVKGLSLQARSRTSGRPVYLISQDGMADAFHVNPYLVCAPCLKLAFDIRIIFKELQYMVMSDGRFSTGNICRHFFSANRMPSDGSVYRTVFCEPSMNDGPVFPSDGVFF